MSAPPIAVSRPRPQVGLFAWGLVMVGFLVGVASGFSLSHAAVGVSHPDSAVIEQTTPESPVGAAVDNGTTSRGPVSPVLDTTRPYTTVQHGVLVPGRSFAVSPVLDTTRPYTTVQHGVLVPGR